MCALGVARGGGGGGRGIVGGRGHLAHQGRHRLVVRLDVAVRIGTAGRREGAERGHQERGGQGDAQPHRPLPTGLHCRTSQG